MVVHVQTPGRLLLLLLRAYCGLGDGNGPTGACCTTSNDCVDTCNSNGMCGTDNGTGEPSTNCGTSYVYTPTCDGDYGTPDSDDCKQAISNVPTSGTLTLAGLETVDYVYGNCEVAIESSTTSISYATLVNYLTQIVGDCVKPNSMGGFVVDGLDFAFVVQFPIPSSA
jgi:hypothetical protein